MSENLIIKGAKMHNLKNISLEIPHNKMTVICGVSGSGKSSLAFDTIFAEGQRQYVESLSPYMRQFLGQKKAADVDEIIGLAPPISIDQKALSHNPRSTVGTLTEIYDIEIVVDKVMLNDASRLSEAVENALEYSKGLVIASYPKNEFLLSSNWTCPNDNFSFPEIEPRLFSFNSPHGACPECSGLGKKSFFAGGKCEVCDGQRLRKEALSIKIGGKSIAEVSALSIKKANDFFDKQYDKLSKKEAIIAESVIVQIISRLEFLLKVGLDYLSLNRESHTLSGGEAQRIRLSSQIGSHLSRTLYVLDEPTIGLHERDTEKLIETLMKLKKKNNTLIIVEHDEKTISASDYLVDLGPLAGVHGGEITACGKTSDLLAGKDKVANEKSLTLKYLRGDEVIEIPKKRRSQNHGTLKIVGARANNLKNINVEIPLGRLVGISGVSGSGKSSFLYDTLYKNVQHIKHRPGGRAKLEDVKEIKGTDYINKVVVINQSPIGRTPRSNPATYTGIFTPIRDFFASLPESRERGYAIGL